MRMFEIWTLHAFQFIIYDFSKCTASLHFAPCFVICISFEICWTILATAIFQQPLCVITSISNTVFPIWWYSWINATSLTCSIRHQLLACNTNIWSTFSPDSLSSLIPSTCLTDSIPCEHLSIGALISVTSSPIGRNFGVRTTSLTWSIS